MSIDAHVHVWDPAFPAHPSRPIPPSLRATATDLLAHMDRAGVRATVLVQPINYMFDHTCLLAAASQHPDRFATVCLADTTAPPARACAALEDLVRKGVRGVRVNPTLAEGGFGGEAVAAVVGKAGELGVPVALFARAVDLGEVGALVRRYPGTKMLLDHFGFCGPREGEGAQEKVLAMGRECANLYVKVSAWFRVSDDEWPHRDLHAYLKQLVEVFGARRMLVGSDYPFVKEQYSYEDAFKVLDEAPLSADDRLWIAGKTAAELYKL